MGSLYSYFKCNNVNENHQSPYLVDGVVVYSDYQFNYVSSGLGGKTLRSFGKNTTTDTWLGIFTCGLYIYYINYTQDVAYVNDRSLVAATKTGDTISSLLFAVVVATLVHTYVMQPYTIPTSSLENPY